MGKVKLSPEAEAKKKAYNKEYARTHLKGKNLGFNISDPDDMALLEWIKQHENGTEYIKSLIRTDMESFEELKYHIMPPSFLSCRTQIPILKDRFIYLTRHYRPNSENSRWVMYHHTGHFMIYERETKCCIFDAIYMPFGLPDNLPEDEIVAVIHEIRINQKEVSSPFVDDNGFRDLAYLIREKL